MSSICIIDTSVFCNILRVPNKDQDHQRAWSELSEHIEAEDTLLLPMATIYETGNHISQNGSGGTRRKVARNFVEQVKKAFTGEAPWVPTPLPDIEEMAGWLNEFPDSAMRVMGLGDLSIVKIFEQQCKLHLSRRVFIWSYDSHLSSYDYRPD